MTPADLDGLERRAKATKRVLGIVPLADDVIDLVAEVRGLKASVVVLREALQQIRDAPAAYSDGARYVAERALAAPSL